MLNKVDGGRTARAGKSTDQAIYLLVFAENAVYPRA